MLRFRALQRGAGERTDVMHHVRCRPEQRRADAGKRRAHAHQAAGLALGLKRRDSVRAHIAIHKACFAAVFDGELRTLSVRPRAHATVDAGVRPRCRGATGAGRR
jgi:hypothetical protein